jgi:multidrug resistance efflux pump
MDMRANSVTLLGKLATAVMRSGEPLWYTGSTHDLPPQIEEAVQNYVDETHTKSVSVLPLRRPAESIDEKEDAKRGEVEEGEVIAALIVEQIEDNRPPEAFAQGVELVSEHSSRALSNSLEHNDLFLMPVWREIGKLKWILRARTLPKTLAAMAAIIAAILFLCLWPAKFEMVANGRIWPADRRDVFVSEDGMVTEVHVKHGDHVEAGQPLVTLRNPDLQREISRILGLKEAAEESLLSAIRSLNELRNPVDKNRAAGQMNELKVQIASYESQLRQLAKRNDDLVIKSPIAGIVVTFRVDDLLENRPLQRGEVPLTIVNPDSEWELDLYMVETKMGHVRSYKPDGDTYKLRYILESDPRNQWDGTVALSNIQNRAELTEEHGHAIRLIGNVDNQADLAEALPGTEVKAKIYCGRKPIGYKWFYQLVEWIQANLLF